MPVTTLKDLESQETMLTTDGTIFSRVAGSNVTWSTNIGLWCALMVAANLLHPPAFVMFLLNGAFLLFNLDAVRRVGRSDVPAWLYVVIAMQALITAQYGMYLLDQVF